MGQTQAWRINSPDVISETIDGESIILHLGSGFYFSATGCGPTVWQMLSTSVPLDQARAVVQAQYDTDGVDLDVELDRFIGELIAEQLLVPAATDATTTVPEVPANVVRTAFVAPTLEKFTDMEDLLLLDPVHEVSPEKGWPHAAPPATAGSGS